VDVFMCGAAHPEQAVSVIETALQPLSVTRQEARRG